jgi:hypothetical protein
VLDSADKKGEDAFKCGVGDVLTLIYSPVDKDSMTQKERKKDGVDCEFRALVKAYVFVAAYIVIYITFVSMHAC